MSRMFPFITESRFNPLGGECHHNCYGGKCWAKLLIKRAHMKKYEGAPSLYWKELKRVRSFTKDDFVFVSDMCDLFGDWVPEIMISTILRQISLSNAQFLLLTKNPKRYLEFAIPSNCVIGATIESDLEDVEDDNDYAPPRNERLEFMSRIQSARKMVSIEPVVAFSPLFAERIIAIKPEFVAIGYDNYKCGLLEPSLAEVNQLIVQLEEAGIKVYKKTLREKRQ